MKEARRNLRKVAQAGLIFSLAGFAISISTGPTWASGIGNLVNNCYGIWWNTDWNQDCDGIGASQSGLYKSTADCTAPQFGDKTIEKYRIYLSQESYDGDDCTFGIHTVHTMFQ